MCRSTPAASTPWLVPLILFGSLVMSRGCTNPGPGPDRPSQVCLLIVEETHLRTPEQAAVLRDATLRAWLAERGHLLRIVDPDLTDAAGQVPSVLVPYRVWRSVEHNRSATLPVCLLVLSDGSVYQSGPLPGSAAALVEWVRQNTASG